MQARFSWLLALVLLAVCFAFAAVPRGQAVSIAAVYYVDAVSGNNSTGTGS